MESIFLTNLTLPPLLFFFLGAAAVLVRSDLEVPNSVAKLLSLYLLLAIGFKGGVALAGSALDGEVWSALGAAVGLSCAVPVYVFWVVRRKVAAADAAAIAATYGSVSAVTFVACVSYLDALSVPWGGHMVAAMALMESPAIIVGILLYRAAQRRGEPAGSPDAGDGWGRLLHEACFNGSVFLITGSLVIGWITGERGMEKVEPFVAEIFTGMLCLFLLDMGIVAMRRFQDFRGSGSRSPGAPGVSHLVALALAFALVNAALGATLAALLSLPEGDALLLTTLAASASYIAVPAAMRLALPEANPGLFLPMSLAVTFPFNLLVGIPLYHQVLRWLAA